MPYTGKVSSPGISVDTNNDGVIDGRIHRIKNAGNFNTFSITNGELTVQGPTGGAAIGGSDTHVQFNDGGVFAGESTLVYNKTSNTLSVSNLTVTGELTVTTTTTLNSNTVTIGDAKLHLNSDFSGAGPSESAGFEVERGDEDNVNFIWNETTDKFAFQVGSSAAEIGEVGSIFATQTASSPTAITYSFATDTDTGIQHTGLNQLGLVVGNARVLKVNANGVHINPSGASGATNALDVVGDATITGSLDVDDINLNGQTVSTTSSNKNLILTPHGSGHLELGGVSGNNSRVKTTDSAHNVIGTTLTIGAGHTTAGTTNNIAGGNLVLQSGQGKGTGVGGNILFKVAPPGSSGSSLNSLVTAITISGNDKSAVFAGGVTVNGNLTVSGTTTTVSSTTVTHRDPVIQLNEGETATDGSGVTGYYSGFQVDRGATGGGSPTDIAITRFVWDDDVDAFRCQIATNAPTNTIFTDTQLRVGTPSNTNDAATKGYVDTQVAATTVDVVSNVATSKILGRVTGGSGNSEELTASQVRTLINVEDGADVTDATNVNAAGAIMHSDLGTKGDLAVGDGAGDVTILGVGTNGHVLTADSSQASGVKWAASTGSGGTIGIANGEYLGANANVADNDFLRVDGTLIEGRTAAQTLSDIAAMPLAGGTFTGNVTMGGTTQFVAPRAVVDDIAAGIATPLVGAASPTVELVRPLAGQIILVTAPIASVHLPDPGANQIGDTYVLINTTASGVTIDRSGLAGVGGHGNAQNLNGGTANGTLASHEAVTLIAITPDTWYGIGL